MKAPHRTAAVIVWGTAVFVGLGLFFTVTPLLEQRFYPVLVDQRVEKIVREYDQVCWTWIWNKRRYATPVIVSWSLNVNGTSAEFQVLPRRQSDGAVVRDVRPASTGIGENRFCAKIPETLREVPELTVRGQINYIVPHQLWTVWQDLPAVPIPPYKP